MPELRDLFETVTTKVEPDLDSWKQQERRQRRRTRNRRVGTISLVAAIVIGLAVLAVTSMHHRTTVPANKPLPVPRGLPPTVSRIEGVWVKDPRPIGPCCGESRILLRFTPDGTFAFDAGGDLATPDVLGTYKVTGRMITFTSGPRGAACPNDTFGWEAGIPEDGRMDWVFVQSGRWANCSVEIGTEWTLTRVSPVSGAGSGIKAEDRQGTGRPPVDWGALHGTWLQEGTGRLLRFGLDRAYAFDDTGKLSTGPYDTGTFDTNGRGTVTLTSGAGSRRCAGGDRWTWKAVKVGSTGKTLRGVVSQDACSHGVGSLMTWIRIAP
jgi:hypothetical protein